MFHFRYQDSNDCSCQLCDRRRDRLEGDVFLRFRRPTGKSAETEKRESFHQQKANVDGFHKVGITNLKIANLKFHLNV